jgi:ribose/xylose/arabinose/galactoside ABC-type transport system permease subunit
MTKKKLDFTKFSTLFVLIGLCVALAILTKSFLSPANITNVLQQVTVNSIISIGMTFVIITGGIDLSVGSIVALSGVMMGIVIRAGAPPFIGMIVCITVGALCGIINGLLITKGKLPPFIATLGMMSMARGAALTIASGKAVSGFPDSLRWIGIASIPGINLPVQVILMLLLFGIAFYILKYRKLGRCIYSIGGNEEVTRLSGINVRSYKTIAYIISGITAAVATIVLTAKLNSAQPIAGYNYELDAVAATVIGGTSLTGGFGSIWGTLVGAIIMGVIRNGLNLLAVSSYLQQFIIGLVIICAVLLDSLKKKS